MKRKFMKKIMKYITICCLICMGCSVYGMKRQPNANAITEPNAKRAKLITEFTPREQQDQKIINHLNNSLFLLDLAQKAINFSNDGLRERLPQSPEDLLLQKKLIHLLELYQSHFNNVHESLQKNLNFLENSLRKTYTPSDSQEDFTMIDVEH